MAEAAVKEFTLTLTELKRNSKPMINALTIMAVDYIEFAKHIVVVIESRIQKANGKEKLPILYLMDSIIKNNGGIYLRYFSTNLVQTFVGAFAKVDEKSRESMFRLRSTWNGVFPEEALHELDEKVKGIDPCWPIITPEPASLFEQELKEVLPQKEIQMDLELQQRKSEDYMRKAPIEKQQQLLQLKRKELEFELQQTKLRVEAQNMEISLKNKQIEVQNRLLASASAVEGSSKPMVWPDPPVEDSSSVEEQPWMQKVAVSTIKTPAQVTPATVPVPTTTPSVRDPRLTSRNPHLACRDSRLRTGPTSSAPPVVPQTVTPQPVKAQPTIPDQVIPQNPLVKIAEPGPPAGKGQLLSTPAQPLMLKNAKEKSPVVILHDILVLYPEMRDKGRGFPSLMISGPGPRMPMPPHLRDGPMNFNGPIGPPPIGFRRRREGPGRPGTYLSGWRDFPPEQDMRTDDYACSDRRNKRTYKNEFGRDVDRRDDRERREDIERQRRIDRRDRERERRRNECSRDTRRDERNGDDKRERPRRGSRERERERDGGKTRSSRRSSTSPHRQSRSPSDKRERDRGSRSENDKEYKQKEKGVGEASSRKRKSDASREQATKKAKIDAKKQQDQRKRPVIVTDDKPVLDTRHHVIGPDVRPLPIGPDEPPLQLQGPHSDVHLGYLEDKDLCLINKHMGPDWKQLGIRLGFSWNEVKQIRHDHRRLSDCTTEMFTQWRGRDNGTNQVEIMDRALKEQGLAELANDVFGSQMSKDQPSSIKEHGSARRTHKEDNGRLADIDMLFIAERLDNEWKSFGIILGMKQTEINQINSDFSPPMVDAILEMLIKWRERQKADVNNLVKMCDALNKLERRDINEELETYYREK